MRGMSFQAIDVWMGLCTAFVFSALVEFTVVNFWYRKQKYHGKLGTVTGMVDANNHNISARDPTKGVSFWENEEVSNNEPYLNGT